MVQLSSILRSPNNAQLNHRNIPFDYDHIQCHSLALCNCTKLKYKNETIQNWPYIWDNIPNIFVCFHHIKKRLPVQDSLSQYSVSESAPTHGKPFTDGQGESQFLCRVFLQSPQEDQPHSPKGLHSDQPPSCSFSATTKGSANILLFSVWIKIKQLQICQCP